MKRFSGLFLFLGFFLSLSVHASRVWSRSIMANCEFVYQVESDVILEAPAELFQIYAGAPLYVHAKLKNSWDKDPRESETFISAVGDNGKSFLSFRSMSVSENFLFREMRFEWMIKDTENKWVSVSPASQSDIGRSFGEACYTERLNDAQYIERSVTP